MNASDLKSEILGSGRLISVRGNRLVWREDRWLYVIRSGRDPRAWRARLDEAGHIKRGWAHVRPRIDQLLRPVPHLRRRIAEALEHLRTPCRSNESMVARAELRKVVHALKNKLLPWLGHFPEEALHFAAQFKTRRWHVLTLSIRVPSDLWRDIPALAWLCASSWLYSRRKVQRPLRSLRTLLQRGRSRRDLLRWLDLPAGDGILKVLRRVEPRDLDPMQARAIVLVLRDPVLRQILFNLWNRHTAESADAHFCATAVHALAYQMPLSFEVLCRLAFRARSAGPEETPANVACLLRDSLRMTRQLEDRGAREQLARVRSVDSLRRLHDGLSARINQRYDDAVRTRGVVTTEVSHVAFPLGCPPWMTPLCTEDALLREGIEMQHCAASYWPLVQAGSYFLLSARFEDERATVGLSMHCGRWHVDQVRGKRNRPASAKLIAAVLGWLPTRTRSFAETIGVLDEARPVVASDERQLWLFPMPGEAAHAA